MDVQKVAIIGSGPAGYTAAVYAARADLSPILFEGQILGGQPGGQLMLTSEVENYPGFPDGLMGPDLMALFRKQAERFGTKILSEDIISVDFSKRPFVLNTSNGFYASHAVIVCTGAQAIWLGVTGEKEYQGRGVSACATCDGFFFKGKHVVVVGGGDSAMEESTYLTKFANKVTVMVRRGELRASKIMQARAMANPKIEFVWNTEVTAAHGDGTRLTGIKTLNLLTSETADFAADGLFMAIGHKPNTEIFKGQLELDQKGYIVVPSWSTRTSVEGIFAGGDVMDHLYRQAITAAGSGCMAALEAERWLSTKE